MRAIKVSETAQGRAGCRRNVRDRQSVEAAGRRALPGTCSQVENLVNL